MQHGANGQPAKLIARSGKWCVHNNRTSYAATYPPHDGTLVEHEILVHTSDPGRVGTSEVLQYALTGDGSLSLSKMELVDGRSHATSTTQWRRVL